MKNRESATRRPQENRLLNDGVVSVGDATTEQEWQTLKFEVEHFVCEGQYHNGLKRILDAYLQNLTGASQQAAWVSGFFGLGNRIPSRCSAICGWILHFPTAARLAAWCPTCPRTSRIC